MADLSGSKDNSVCVVTYNDYYDNYTAVQEALIDIYFVCTTDGFSFKANRKYFPKLLSDDVTRQAEWAKLVLILIQASFSRAVIP